MTQIKRIFLSTYKNLIDYHFFQVANTCVNVVVSFEGGQRPIDINASFKLAVSALNDVLKPEWDENHEKAQEQLKKDQDFHALYQACVSLALRRRLLRNRKVVAITSVLSKSKKE